MRPSLYRDLAALFLAFAICRSPVFAGGPRSKPTPRPAEPVRVVKVVKAVKNVKSWEEKGYGVTEALARKNALESLREHVNDWLSANHPEITYSPSPAELEGMVREYSEPQPWRSNNKELQELNQVQMLEVQLTADLTDANLQSFDNQTRELVSRERQKFLGRGLAGAVALLAVATGYLRLEEKVGRHKRKLGLVAAGIIGLVGLTLLALGRDFF